MNLTSALKLNLAEMLWSFRYRATEGVREERIVRQIIDRGYAIEENFLSDATVDRLVAEADEIYKTQRKFIKVEYEDERLYGIDRLSKVFHLPEEMSLPDRLYRKFELSWRKGWFQLFGRLKASEGNLGSGGGWHRDSPFSHQFKSIIYLTDVTSLENGPFEFIPQSHLKPSIERFTKFLGLAPSVYRFTDEQITRAERAGVVAERVPILGRRGTMLMVDTRGLHRGRPILQGSRMALTRYYHKGRYPRGWNLHPELLRPID